ncbi:MAG TPA: TRL domain-containing protein [Myxococcales bacterium]|nr:TRL domain-containing protein [Myxococcales bacterium]
MKRLVLAAAAAVSFTGCAAVGPIGGLFTSATIPHSYFSPTQPLSGTGPEAHGEACSMSILGLAAFGDSGYDSAYKAAVASSGASSLYDVRVDTKVFSILGFVYSTFCTELTGRVAK